MLASWLMNRKKSNKNQNKSAQPVKKDSRESNSYSESKSSRADSRGPSRSDSASSSRSDKPKKKGSGIPGLLERLEATLRRMGMQGSEAGTPAPEIERQADRKSYKPANKKNSSKGERPRPQTKLKKAKDKNNRFSRDQESGSRSNGHDAIGLGGKPSTGRYQKPEGSRDGRYQKSEGSRPNFRENAKRNNSSNSRSSSAPVQMPNQLIGTVKRHPDGFGFLIPDDVSFPDVYIPKQSMATVMTNDKVEARIFPSRRGDRFFGEIDRIVARQTKQVTGRLTWANPNEAFLVDDSKTWGANMRVMKEFSMGAEEGEFVSAEITAYPSARGEFQGRVIKRIGDAASPLNDVKRAIAVHQVPEGFSRKALQEAEAYGHSVDPKDIENRVDLRALPFITIDGATAKDFDDAIYVEQTDKGFRAYVAIADVSHYVKKGTALDEEAYLKGNSTYFPNYVVPMLPENLSNVLCSLNPHVDRLALVADMHLDFLGEVLHAKFYEAVINSHARVTYGEAQEVVDDKPPEKLLPVAEHIRLAGDLSKILMTKRFKEGSLDLDIPSTEVLLNVDGEPVDLVRSERLFAHRLIEELMLLANVCVAKFITSNDRPAIFRVHDAPKEEDVENLQRYLSIFGSKRELHDGNLQKKLTKALQDFQGKPEAQVLNILTLRAMTQAKYSADNNGHFGLGFSHYTHFTSPIRRYADLVVHRVLKSLVQKGYDSEQLGYDELATIGTMISSCEQRSVKAERFVVSVKKARFMEKFIGQEFDGVISSVAKFGIFVLLRQFDIDGLVKLEDLGGDHYEFDEENITLYAKRSGHQFAIGDSVKVQVAAVKVDEGQIDFVLSTSGDSDESDQDADKDREDVQERSSPQEDSGDVRKVRLSRRRRKN